MNKKYLIILFGIVLISISFVISFVPQFLIFQGNVEIDGRTASQGTIINFSIQGTELNTSIVNNEGKYGRVMIQGYEEYYGEPINITINNYESEQKINYTYPQDVCLNLSSLTEDALKISDFFPEESQITKQKTGTQEFNIVAESGYNDPINYEWFLDGELLPEEDSNSYTYIIKNSDGGSHNIKVVVNDGYLTRTREWTLIIARPEATGFDGETTDFDSIKLDELDNVEDVVLEKTNKGKIEFLENLNLTGLIDIQDYIKIENGVVAIDSINYPQLNKSARITLRGLNYKSMPKIYYDEEFTVNADEINKECDFCSIINYTQFPTTNGEVIFIVEHFSSFKVEETPVSKSKKSSHKKELIQFCDVNWKCSGWSACINGLMARQCYDENYCDYAYNKPVEETGCDIPSKSLVKKEKGFNLVLFGTVFTLLLMGLLIFLLARQKHI